MQLGPPAPLEAVDERGGQRGDRWFEPLDGLREEGLPEEAAAQRVLRRVVALEAPWVLRAVGDPGPEAVRPEVGIGQHGVHVVAPRQRVERVLEAVEAVHGARGAQLLVERERIGQHGWGRGVVADVLGHRWLSHRRHPPRRSLSGSLAAGNS